MTDEKTIPLTLPTKVWGGLASAADIEHVSIGDIIAEAIQARLARHSVPPRPAPIREHATYAPAKVVADLADPSTNVRIRELHQLARSGPEIARELGVTYSKLLPILHEMGLVHPSRKRKGRVDMGQLAELHAQGLSDPKIAEALKVSPEAVRVNRNLLHLPSNSNYRSRGSKS